MTGSALLDEIAGLPAKEDAYDKLPLSIRKAYSRKEWEWLGDDDKDSLVTRETEPDCYED